MNELRRTAYLNALGVDSYVSRRQLPGAATTQRLVIVPRVHAIVESIVEPMAEPVAPPAVGSARIERHSIDALDRPGRPVAQRNGANPEASEAASQRQTANVPRFSLAAIVAGDWLWLESLEDRPLATQQLQLISAMAHALAVVRNEEQGSGAAAAEWAQFDWPIHHNKQLDEGIAAARAGVAGFVARKLQHHRCRGLVLLGQQCHEWVPREQLDIATVSTSSSADMLSNSVLKMRAWQELLPLVDAV